MIVMGIALAGTEEIGTSSCQCQLISRAPYQSFLYVIGLLSIQTTQVGVIRQDRFIVRQALCLLHQLDCNLLWRVRLGKIDRVNPCMLEARLGVPLPRVERKAGTVAPFMAEGVKA